ncbi:UNVERIFIED_CONTAM: hypothetical protein FKN15_015343 [Acipenser sinensis]
MNIHCPPKRVPSADRFFSHCGLNMQPPKSYSVGGQRSSQAATGKPAGAQPDYNGLWCAVSRGHPGRPNPSSRRRRGGEQPMEAVAVTSEKVMMAIPTMSGRQNCFKRLQQHSKRGNIHLPY